MREALSGLERDVSVLEIDATLDRLASMKRVIAGRLTAGEVPGLNAQLSEVFEEFRVTAEGSRIVVDPRLQVEVEPPGQSRPTRRTPRRAPWCATSSARFSPGPLPSRSPTRWTRGGIPPPRPGSPHPYQRRGAACRHQSTIRDMLANPLYGGFASHKGCRVKACGCAELEDPDSWDAWTSCDHPWVVSHNVPPVVEAEAWERGQETLDRRRRPGTGGRGNRASSMIFLLTGLVWCGLCGEGIGTRTSKRGRHVYVCRSRRMGARCVLPRIPQAELDEAVRESFVRNFVDALDVQRTIEREREALLACRSDEAALARDEVEGVEREIAELRDLAEQARQDYERGALAPELFSRLDEDYRTRLDERAAALANLRAALGGLERDMSVLEIDAVLDHLASVRRVIAGRLTAEDVPELNAQLAEVFEEFRVTVEGERVVVDPRLKPEFQPPGEWRTVDFGEPDQRGVEVVEHLGAIIRKVELK